MTKYEKMQKLGEYEIDFDSMEEAFDPMRLKIILWPKKDANAFGKNPDYFFIKGIDYLNLRDF